MKSKDWKTVKVHQWLILAREDVGVVKAEVVEVDVKVEEPLPTFHYDYPYGVTAETGVIKIRFEVEGVEKTEVENLANLIKFNSTTFRTLLKAYNDWQTYKTYADAYKEAFLSLIQQRIAQ